MTKQEFLQAVRNEKILSSAFNLDGEGDECYVLSKNDGNWSVYYSERGMETSLRHFISESDALECLLEALISDPSTRLKT